MLRHLFMWATLGLLMMVDRATGRTTELPGLAYDPPPLVGKTQRPIVNGSRHKAQRRALKDFVLPPLSAPISFTDLLPAPPVAVEWPSLDVSGILGELLSQPCIPSPPLQPSPASIRRGSSAGLWEKVKNAIKGPQKGKS